MLRGELNLRDLGDVSLPEGMGSIPHGRFLRSGKLSLLSEEQCARLCKRHAIGCVIDLRTPIEASEFPDPLPEGVEYLSIPLIKDNKVGITHETGSDPMTIIRGLRRNPERLKDMIPDFKALYSSIVTDDYSRRQLERAVAVLRMNAEKGVCTLFHCTAGKDRTGIVSMALLKSYGVADEEIIRDYMLTNRNAWLPTMRKCMAIMLMTWNWGLVRMVYRAFMADRELIKTALRHYTGYGDLHDSQMSPEKQ